MLYGDNGVPAVSYEIDGFQDEWGAALEVEAGQGRANNNDYRDIVRTSLILEAIYASTRLKLPFEGLLLVGY